MGKLKKQFVTIMGVITLIGLGVGGFLWYNYSNERIDLTPSASDVLKLAVTVPEVTATTKDGNYDKMSVTLVAFNKKGVKELNDRMFQVSGVLTAEINDKRAEELIGKENLTGFEGLLKERINSLLQEGQVRDVYIVTNIV